MTTQPPTPADLALVELSDALAEQSMRQGEADTLAKQYGAAQAALAAADSRLAAARQAHLDALTAEQPIPFELVERES